MKMKKIINSILILSLLGFNNVFAQKAMKTYYDPVTMNNVKETYFVNASGLKHGMWKLYSKDGILMSEYNYSNGKKNGNCIDYYEFGEVAGNTIGVTCTGKPLTIENYINGEPTGTHSYYTCKDKTEPVLKEKIVYSTGKFTQTFYYPSGKVKSEVSGNRRNGMNCKNGKYIDYYENGQIRTKGEYKDIGGNYESVQIGKWEYYFEDGKVLGEANYDDFGNPLGKFMELDKNGNVIADGEFVVDLKSSSNKFNGTLYGYHENGKKAFEVVVLMCSSNDKNMINQYISPNEYMFQRYVKILNGKLIIWNSNGEIETENDYENGILK